MIRIIPSYLIFSFCSAHALSASSEAIYKCYVPDATCASAATAHLIYLSRCTVPIPHLWLSLTIRRSFRFHSLSIRLSFRRDASKHEGRPVHLPRLLPKTAPATQRFHCHRRLT
jgi:hypothetical protein